jgi:alkanesulfonate monooxygenase SsuD/methylene tetrahydromethanopterin reductase-like flavin-dependent oxidoreductase (luciferase family)
VNIGICLPAMVPGREGASIVRWAQAAEERSFSTLAVNDALLADNFEPLVTLASAAAVTTRIRLLTAVLIAPLRSNTALLAKQTATIDAISDGRLSLGVAVGPRPLEYETSGLEFSHRGRTLDRQLAWLEELWSAEEPRPGPAPRQARGPEILIGASSPAAMARIGRFGSGYIAGYGPPGRFAHNAALAEEAWRAGGREGAPRKVALAHFALGRHGRRNAESYVRSHADQFGAFAELVLAAVATEEESIKQLVAAYESAGCDELVFTPCDESIDQVERLAEAAGPVPAERSAA